MKTILRLLACCGLWTLPSGAQEVWTNLGPHGGLIDAVVADQTSSGTLIAGTQTGDFYRSTNEGQSWYYLSALPEAGNAAIARLVMDSANGQRLYAATAQQIYSSSNGGITWNAAANSEVQSVFDMSISPVNASQLYAAASDKIWRSFNYGLSWSTVYEADDTLEVTAFAFSPFSPQNRFFMALLSDHGRARIYGTENGGTSTTMLYQLPLDWIVAKLFVADDPSSTLMALIGGADSTKIIRSTNGGAQWSTVYAVPIPLFHPGDQLKFFNWITARHNNQDQIIGTLSGLLRSTNGGSSWSRLVYVPEVFTTTLARSPDHASVLYGRALGQGAGLSKILIHEDGSLSFTDINYGLTATRIEKVHFSEGRALMAESNTNELLVSQNGGFDFNRFALDQNAVIVTAYRSRVDEAFYWLSKNGKMYKSENGISSALFDSVEFPPNHNKVWHASYVNYYDVVSEGDSTLLVAAVGSDALSSGNVMISADDGVHWKSINYVGPFSTTIPRRLSVDFESAIHIYAANDQAIFRQTYKGAPVWTPAFNVAQGYTIKTFTSRFGTLLLVVSENMQGKQRLDFAFLNPQSAQWESHDISASLVQVDPLRRGAMVDIYAGEDANYLLYDFVDGTRRIFKASVTTNSAFVWHDITDSPLDQLHVLSIIDDNDYEDQSFNLFAGADNGIWVLKQLAILSQDTSVTTTPTSVNRQDTTVFPVLYRNDGTAVAVVDSFRITTNSDGAFGFVDPILEQTSYPVAYPLDLRSTTPIQLFFSPTQFGTSHATLTAYYRGRSSRGIDSTFSLRTHLIGTTKASRISTGLRGDTLELRGTMLYGSKTVSLPIGNSGNDTLYVYELLLDDGSPFQVEEPSEIGTDGFFTVSPGQSRNIPVTFSPSQAGLQIDHVTIVSSAHQFLTNTPDAEHVITLTGVGSALEVTNLSSLRPQLGQNQGISLNLSLAQLTATDVTSTLYYRKIGNRSAGFSSVVFTPAVGQSGFVATIPQDEVTQNGLEFYIESRASTAQGGVTLYFPDLNRSDSTYALPVSIPRPGLGSSGYLTLPGGTKRNAFQLVSMPIRLTNNTPQGAFSESNLGTLGDKSDWQLYRYIDAQERWLRATDTDISFGTIESGQSYLIISRHSRTLNTGAGRTMIPEDAHVVITPGWNMIANPYAFSISWLDVALYNDRVEFGSLVTLQDGRFRYVEDTELGQLHLEPWKGYMYHSPSDSGTYDLYYPAVATSTLAKPNPRRLITRENLSRREYVLDLILTGDEFETIHHIGEILDARPDLDPFDKAALPALSRDEVRLLIHGQLHSDFRSISEDGQYWDFTIGTQTGSARVKLTMEGLAGLPDGFEAVLVDRDGNTTLANQDLSVNAGTRQKSYRLFVGTPGFIENSRAELIPTSFYLDRNFPNPFNPSTVIRYGLPKPSRVELHVYNMLGQRVRTLTRTSQPAGVFEISWDGRNDSGDLVSSGIYVYRLQASATDGHGHFTRSNKMTFLK